MADDNEEYPIIPGFGEGMVKAAEDEAKAAKDKAKAEERETKAEERESKAAEKKAGAAEDEAKAAGKKAKAEGSGIWGLINKELGEQFVSNANFVGVIAFVLIGMHAFNFLTGFNIATRLVFAVITFGLLAGFLHSSLLWSALRALGDLLIPTIIINAFIVKSPSPILYYFLPKVVWDFLIGLLPVWSKEIQVALTLLALILMPSLLYIFGTIKIDKDTKSALYGIAKIVYIAAIIYALFSLTAGVGDMIGIPAAKTVAQVTAMGPEGQKLVAEAINSLMTSPQTASKWLKNVYEQQVNIATGGEYYAGQVEQTKNKPVGVYIDSLKAGDPVLYSRQPVSVWADLRVVTLADKPVTINTSCIAEDPVNGIVIGKTEPKEIEIDLTGREVVQCRFNSLEHGAVPVNFTAEFEFTTEAYMNAYFMERDRMVALLNENKNPYDLYPVPTRNPVAIYTNGPVEIGMELENPIGLSTSSKVPMPILGVTIAPRWKGSISDIESIVIYVPNGVEIDKESCDHDFVSLSSSPKQGYKAYKLSGTDALRRSLKETKYQTFRCRLNVISQSSIETILKNEKGQSVPLATKYVFVDAKYKFALLGQISLTVKESPEEEQERIAAEKARLEGNAPSTAAPPSTSAPTPPSNTGTAPSVICTSLNNYETACMSSKEEGTNCVYLEETYTYSCKKCDPKLCCSIETAVQSNKANILSRCAVNCSTVQCS